MKLIGLTGGIASGKSAAASLLRARGVPVVDADQLAREVVQPGSDGLAVVAAAFPGVVGGDGALDRARLGAVVFADDDARRRLNGILHPRIAALAAEKTAAIAATGAPVCVYEAPLLFENGLDAAMDATILIAVDEATQLRRLMERDGLDEAAARARVAAQMPLHEKRARATIVVENTGTRDDLARALDAAWARLLERSA